ncbi:hypothetical protein J6590_068616 [Homalodisca vitripennis]|nr:hypothetical protein J6590_068616 [Homalodisca vitripennis]
MILNIFCRSDRFLVSTPVTALDSRLASRSRQDSVVGWAVVLPRGHSKRAVIWTESCAPAAAVLAEHKLLFNTSPARCTRTPRRPRSSEIFLQAVVACNDSCKEARPEEEDRNAVECPQLEDNLLMS